MTTPEELTQGAEAAHPDDEEAQAKWIKEVQRLYDAAGSAN
jgi:hypothetical protein